MFSLAATLVWLCGCGHAPEVPTNVRLDEAIQLSQQGSLAYKRGEFATAIGCFESALRLDLSIENHEGIVNGRLNLAQALQAAGKTGEAQRQLDFLLEQGAKPISDAQRARAAAAKALLQLKQGQTADAGRWAGQARRDCHETCPDAAPILNIQSRIALDRGDVANAQSLAQAALALLEPASDESATSLRLIGAALLRQGKANDAAGFFQRALAIDRELGLPARIADDLMQLGDAHGVSGNKGKAKDFYRRALVVAEAANEKTLVKLAQEKIAQLEQQKER